MKLIKIILVILILAAIFSAIITSCTDFLNKAPEDISTMHERGESISVDGTYFNVTQSFQHAKKKDGYIENIDAKVKVQGYDADFTYFNCYLTVTWTYNEISDAYPSGIEQTISSTIELNANGDGEYTCNIPLDSCRGIYDVKVGYSWSGTATRL